MNRQNQLLAVLLVIQIAIGVAVFWPWASASEAAGGPLFDDFEAEAVETLTISDGEGNSLTLAQETEGWVLPEADDFPVASEKVTSLLEKIDNLQTNRLVTQTEASHRRLQVAEADFNRLVSFILDNDTTHELFVGSSAGAGATHVRADNQEEVYLAGELNSWEVNPQASAWIDPLYFTLPQTATVSLTLENPNGTFTFEKEGETWTMAGLTEAEVLNPNAVTTLVNQASSVRMTGPIGLEPPAGSGGLDEPQATVTLETAAGETHSLLVGAQDPDNNNSYVAKASTSPYYVRIDSFTGEAFVNKTRTDFLQEPPAPEAEATGEPE